LVIIIKMYRIRLREILETTNITLCNEKYYLNGLYMGDFEELCMGLSYLNNISSSEKEYFKEISVKTLNNSKERRKVGKEILRRVADIQNEKVSLPRCDLSIGNFEKHELIKGEKTINVMRVDDKWLYI
jgi:hypothetical protein